jgi:hypothetical protein
MNTETIQKRLDDLKSQKDVMMNNLHGILGAIQDCEYWLNLLKEQQNASTEVKE